ncbi:YhgE/Pip family protein [Paenibacillus sp. HJGM_3]|uniref:YhgE/Pip domain-containing protein n=1 Tax=Paenibacillus sp. HJGM_3 TaxID=3379816 RepID=UPI00385EB42B
MRNMFTIYKTDWRNLFKAPMSLLLLAALAVLPSLYAWINLEAMWDPYGNTSGIRVAVTSQDIGATVRGQAFNIGEEVVASLRDNRQLGWTIVDADEARRGVEEGDYYASLLIPASFSSQMATVVEGSLQKPELLYTVNEKISAIAPKITAKGAAGVTETISQSFIRTVSETVLNRLKELGYAYEQQLPKIRMLEAKVLDLEQHLGQLEAIGRDTVALEQKLPELKAKGDRLVQLEARLPELDQAGGTILKLEERWPRIEEAAREALAVRDRLPDFQQAAALAAAMEETLGRVEAALAGPLALVGQADTAVRDVLQALPSLEALAATGGAYADRLPPFLAQQEAAFQALPPVLRLNAQLARQAAEAVALAAAALPPAGGASGAPAALAAPAAAATALAASAERLGPAADALGHARELLAALRADAAAGALEPALRRLAAAEAALREQGEAARAVAAPLARGAAPASGAQARLDAASREASRTLSAVSEDFDTAVAPALAGGLQAAQAAARDASGSLQQLKPQLPELQALAQSARGAVEYARSRFGAMQAELPQIHSRVQGAARRLQDKLGAFVNVMNEAGPFLQNDLPCVGQRVHEAADFVRNDWPTTEQELRRLADLYRTKLPDVENAVHQAADFVRTDFPAFETAVRNAADAVRRYQGDASIAELLAFLHRDIQQESDFLANPVVLKEQTLYPIPNYGSAMSPFYTTLALWVGAMLLVSLLKMEVDEGAEASLAPAPRAYKSHEVYFGRMGIFLTVGLLQALIVTLGNYFILGTYVVHKGWFLLFALLISFVFVTITYTLVSVFGNIGKGLAIVFLVLQFSSSGGTFPVTTASPFFQKLNPFVPFTYAVSALREAVGGILAKTVVRDISFLLLSVIVCYIAALVLKEPLSRYTRRMAEAAEKSKLF